ncbi:MAG: hypothetical protein OXG24_06010 [Gammaproteobacteria bacterium]|nr:hypothetical protein [Gammaproteobacteria bacterium]
MSAITSILSELQLGDPAHCDNLSLVPLFSDVQEDFTYITLEKGLETTTVEIEELDGGARVSDILLRNLSDSPVLLIEGEELLGAMQNRILNVSVLVSPLTKQVIPVSCVEAGRWNHQESDPSKQKFSTANRMHYARGRALESRAVSLNLQASREYRSDQSKIWQDIDEKSARLNVHSESSAADAMYVSKSTKIDKFVNSFKHLPSQVGSVFLVDGKVSGLDLYSNESIHTQMLPRLIRSYALDAIDSSLSSATSDPKATDSNKDENATKAVDEFLAQLSNSWSKRFKGVCMGENIRFMDDRLTGSALEFEERVLHLTAFTLPKEETESPVQYRERRIRPLAS